MTGLDSGDFLSEPFLSLPFPSTVFLKEPFLLRLCTSAIAPFVRSLSTPSLLSVSLFVRRNLDRRQPDMDRLCVAVSLRFFVRGLSFSGGASSSILGNGMGFSEDSTTPLDWPFIADFKALSSHIAQDRKKE